MEVEQIFQQYKAGYGRMKMIVFKLTARWRALSVDSMSLEELSTENEDAPPPSNTISERIFE